MMDFTRDLIESRMTRNEKNLQTLSYRDCCERLFLAILALEAMRQYPDYQDQVSRYAKSTLSPGKFQHYRLSGTDLYNFIYFVSGSDEALSKLADAEDAKSVRQSMIPPIRDIEKYLRSVADGKTLPDNFAVLQRIERNLKITNTDYATLRRWIANFRKISREDRRLLVTRLLMATRAKLRSFDLVDDIEKWAADKNLEQSIARDPELSFSTPDIAVGDLSLYRYLVGPERLTLLKQFVEQAKSGKSVNAQLVNTYLPIVEMVDDIVSGGPAYIQQLKLLHQRAKKSPRK